MVRLYPMDLYLLPSALRPAESCLAEATTEVVAATEGEVQVAVAPEAAADPSVLQPTPGPVVQQL